MLVLYLAELKYTDREIGAIFTFTLFGDSIISLLLTTHADKYGRRNCLIAGSAVAVVTSILFITQASHVTILLLSATLGVISPSGNEVGPFNAIEISCLAQITEKSMLTKILAWYNLFGCVFCALGSLSSGFFIDVLQSNTLFQQGKLESYRTVLIMYTFVQLLMCFLFFGLGRRVELPKDDIIFTRNAQSNPWFGLRQSKGIVIKMSLLIALEAFSGSFIMQTLISNWFIDVYDTSPKVLGTLLFFCNLLAGISALFSATIASYIGLIWTMVLTDIPSNILTIFVPLMPNEMLAIVLLCCQFSISQMNVPTRNAYLQGIVEPDERSAANGVTNIARSFGAISGPVLSGLLLANSRTVNDPWFIAGGLKICYDLLLLWNFGSVKSTSDVYE
jgi:MFS family permease